MGHGIACRCCSARPSGAPSTTRPPPPREAAHTSTSGGASSRFEARPAPAGTPGAAQRTSRSAAGFKTRLPGGARLIVEAAPGISGSNKKRYDLGPGAAEADALLCSNSSAPVRHGHGLTTAARAHGRLRWVRRGEIPCVESCAARKRATGAWTRRALDAAAGKGARLGAARVPGFLGNRLQHALLAQKPVNLVERGIASPENVDRVVRVRLRPALQLSWARSSAPLQAGWT